MNVHSALGPGLLEGVYEECLCHELYLSGIRFQRQVCVPIQYKSINLASALRLDLLVEDAIVVEVKAVERLLPVHESQLLTYLRLSRLRVGYLLNFNTSHLRDGIRRRVL